MVTAAVLVSPAAAVAAGWTSPKAVQLGINPVLSFSPTGAAVLGSELTARGKLKGTDIDLAPNGSTFAASPWDLSAPSAGHGAEPLSALALNSDGYVAAGFDNPNTPTPVLARVAQPPPSNFAGVQQLVPLGAAASGQASADSLTLVATTDGELVGAGTDDAGDLYTATLAARKTTFAKAHGPKGFSATDAYALTTDQSGNTFLAGDGVDGCSTVAFRTAHGTFKTTYATGNCNSATPNIFDAITATSNGDAALLTEDVSESGTGVSRLLSQVGRDGHFGTPTPLGSVLGGPVGLASDADGEITAEWTGCEAGPIVNGQLTTTDCDIDAATGSITTGFRTSAATGTTLLGPEPGATLTAFTADRAVAVSRCRSGSCGLYAFTAKPGGGFRPAHVLGNASKLITLKGDDHGDLIAVWADAHDHIYAATASAASGRWSTAHRLSSQPVSPSTVTVAYGPHGRAIVAWSTASRTYAAGYSTSGP
jgi:hypothetical protein